MYTTLWRVKALLRRRGVLLNGILAILIAIGAGVAYFSLNDDAGASSPGRIVRVSRGNVVSSVSASGSVASSLSRDLSFGTSGTVDSVKVKVGDKVKKGQVLATVDDASASDDLRSAKAALDAAESGDTSTPSGYSSYVQAKASYAGAQRALDGTEITAPFHGTVIAVNGSVGGSSSGGRVVVVQQQHILRQRRKRQQQRQLLHEHVLRQQRFHHRRGHLQAGDHR